MSEEVIQGLSAESYRIPSKWNRNTVADGSWLQKYTLSPLSARDYYLASAIDSVSGTASGNIDELSAAISSVSAIHDNKISGLSSSIDYVSGAIDTVSSELVTSSQVLELAINNESATRADETQYLSAAIIAEQEARQDAVSGLQNQIDTMNAATDVINVFGSYGGFSTDSAKYFEPQYSAAYHLTNNDIIKVINDEHTPVPVGETGETSTGHQTYYQWVNKSTVTGDPTSPSDGDWNFVGYTDPYYNIAEIDDIVHTVSSTLSSTIASTYLSANGIAVQSGHNIVITKPDGDNTPHIKIETSSHVTFDGISSTNLSATNASGENLKYDNVTAVNLSSNKVSATNLSATTISASELSAIKLSASELSAITLSASTAYGQSAKFTDISSTNLTALTASGNEAIFTNISAQNISGDNFNTDNIIAKNISATESFSGNVLTLSNSALIPGISSTNISSVNISSSNVTALTAKGNSAIYNTYSGEYLIGISGDTNVTASIANLINSAANGGSMTGLKNASGIVLNFNPTQTILFTNSADAVNIYVSGGASNWIGFNYDDMNNAIAVTGDLSNILEDYMPKAWSGWNNSTFEGSARLAGSAFEAYSAGSASYATSASSAFSASRAFSAASAYSAYYATSAGTANSSLSAANAEKLGGNAPSYYMNTANINYNAGGKISGYGGTAFVGGLTALQAQNSVLTAEKIKITSGNGIDVIPTGTNEIVVRANKDLIGSANSGQSAYNWITAASATLSSGPGIEFTSAGPNTLGISLSSDISAYSISAQRVVMSGEMDGGGGRYSIVYTPTAISAIAQGMGYSNVYSSTWTNLINVGGNYVPWSARACPIGSTNTATDDGFAQGANNYGVTNSMAQGYYVSAYSNSFAQGTHVSATYGSIAQGQNVTAINDAQAFGYHASANHGFAVNPGVWGSDNITTSAYGAGYAFGNGCYASGNGAAIGYKSSAFGGFSWGYETVASGTSIAMGAYIDTKDRQIQLGWFGKNKTSLNNGSVFSIGYGQTTADRRDLLDITKAGVLQLNNTDDSKNPTVFKVDGDFITSPYKWGTKIPLRMAAGLSSQATMTAGVIDVVTDHHASNYYIFGDDNKYCNLWFQNPPYNYSTTFKLLKASCEGGYGTYRLAVGVQSGYAIMFKNFNSPNGKETIIATGSNVTGAFPQGAGNSANYGYYDFYMNSATTNTHIYFKAVPNDMTVTFTVDNVSKTFCMVKGWS